MALPLLNISQAVQNLQMGNIIAYPTEAVFGLGCDPFNEQAAATLRTLKTRQPNQGFICIAATIEQILPWILPVSAAQWQIICETWPGPYTWVFRATDKAPPYCITDHNTIAVRVTAHPASRELCLAWGNPLISTSANPKGLMPSKTVTEVNHYFSHQIAGIVNGALGKEKQVTQIRMAETGLILRDL